MTLKLLKLKKKNLVIMIINVLLPPEFNNLSARVFTARLAQANLITAMDFDDKLKSLNQKINSNKTKHLLVENEFKKLQTFDSIYFRGKSHSEEDGTQNYLLFQPIYRYFKRILGFGSGTYIYFWKSKGLSDENITGPTAAPILQLLSWY